MAEPTLPPYLGRTLLEDESDAEEAHQRERVERGSLDSNVEKGEARGQRFLITTLGTWIDLKMPMATPPLTYARGLMVEGKLKWKETVFSTNCG